MFGASGGGSGVRPALDTWQHNCLVWTGPQTKTLQAYVDGDLKIDLNYYTLETNRSLSDGGAIVLGQYRQSSGKVVFFFSHLVKVVSRYSSSKLGDDINDKEIYMLLYRLPESSQ